MQKTRLTKPLNPLLYLLLATALLWGYPACSQQDETSTFYTDSIYSQYLKEYRKHNIYLPHGFDKTKSYPIIYATDGDMWTGEHSIKRLLDSLISNKAFQPVIFVGSHSNSKAVENSSGQTQDGMSFSLQYRLFEYVETDQEVPLPELEGLFQNHLDYFTKELIPQVEKELNQEIDPSDRIFYGVSNGGGFGANLLNKVPSLIGTYICYSTLGSNVANNTWSTSSKYPKLYLQYGNEEDSFFKQESEALKKRYGEVGSFCDLRVYEGGHDQDKWYEEFTKTLSEIL